MGYNELLSMQPDCVRKTKQERGRANVADLRQLEEQVRSTFEEHGGKTSNGRLASAAKLRDVMILADLPDVHGDNFETLVFDHMTAANKNDDGGIDFEDYVSFRNAVLDQVHAQKPKERLKKSDASEW